MFTSYKQAGRWGCAAAYCSLRNSEMYYRFPTDEVRRQVWIDCCKREADWFPIDSDRLCSAHFELNQTEINPNGKRVLIPAAIPSIFACSNLRKQVKMDLPASPELNDEQEMLECCVEGCEDTASPRYPFPNPEEKLSLFKKWVSLIQNPQLNGNKRYRIFDKYFVCGRHFDDECIENDSLMLDEDAFPTKFLSVETDDGETIEVTLSELDNVHNYSRAAPTIISKKTGTKPSNKTPIQLLPRFDPTQKLMKKEPVAYTPKHYKVTTTRFNLAIIEKKYDSFHLLYLISHYRHIYDMNHQFHYNPPAQNQAWDEIAASIGLTVAECRIFWKNMKAQYTLLAPNVAQRNKWEYFSTIHELLQSVEQTIEPNDPEASLVSNNKFNKCEKITFLVNGEEILVFPDVGQIDSYTVSRDSSQISAKIGKWHELLAEIAKCKCLYDPSDANYDDGDAVNQIWKNISKEVQLSVVECRSLWMYFKSKFEKTIKASSVNTVWDFFSDMGFYLNYALAPEDVFTSTIDKTQSPAVQSTSKRRAKRSFGDYVLGKLEKMDVVTKNRKKKKLIEILEKV